MTKIDRSKAPATVSSTGDLKAYLTKDHVKQAILDVIHKEMTLDRLYRLCLLAANRKPKILKCTLTSIVQAMMDAAQLGLDPSGTTGEAWLIPYGNQLTFQAGYKGLAKIALRHPDVLSIEAHVIHANDEIDFQRGTDERFIHRPCILEDPGPPVAVYSKAILVGGLQRYETMRWSEVEHTRDTSGNANSLGWKSYPEEMGRKTVLIRHCKQLPQPDEMAAVYDIERRNDQIVEVDATMKQDAGPLAMPRRRQRTKAEMEAARAADEVFNDAKETFDLPDEPSDLQKGAAFLSDVVNPSGITAASPEDQGGIGNGKIDHAQAQARFWERIKAIAGDYMLPDDAGQILKDCSYDAGEAMVAVNANIDSIVAATKSDAK